MSKRKSTILSESDKELLLECEEEYAGLLKAFDIAKNFKLGDYIVAYDQDGEIKRDSYGGIIKYKVIVIDKNGLPFIKRIKSKYRYVGELLSVVSLLDDTNYSSISKFEIDQDYTDSVILGEEEIYDPTSTNQSNSKLHKEITQHNAQLRLKAGTKPFKEFFSVLAPGDQIWRSSDRCWIVLSRGPNLGRDRFGNKYVISVKDSKSQKEILLTHTDLLYKVFYKDKPRSYKELKNPIL